MEFLLIALAHFLALLSPGPDFFLILQASLRLPFRYAMAVCAGIALANGVYLLMALLGLEVIRSMTGVMVVLKYLGAGYLVVIGILLLRAKANDSTSPENKNFLHRSRLDRQFMVGFMSGILNPKNALFYLALFTAMVSAQTPFWVRLLYALWMVLVVFVWDSSLAYFISRDGVKIQLGRGVFFLEKASGLMLTLFGILLPFT